MIAGGCLALLLALLSTPTRAQESCLSRGFSDAEAQVIDAYIAFYGRAPDVGGLQFWSGELDREGGGLGAIIQEFGTSQEFTERFGQLSNTELVENLYQQLFGRGADPEGRTFYVGELESGRRTLQSIALDILNGARGGDREIIDNRAAVSQHYVTEATNRGGELPGDTIFTVLSDVTDDAASASGACATVTGAFSGDAESPGVAESLRRLNVDTEKTPRVGKDGEPLPDDYSPLGPRETLGGSDEFYIAGLTRKGETRNSSLLSYERPQGSGEGVTLHLPGFDLDTAWKQSPYNAAAAGDLDGDGFDEIAQLWWNASSTGITLNVLDDKSGAYGSFGPSVITTSGDPDFLRVETADLDGDGTDEVIVGIVENNGDDLRVIVLQGSMESGYNASSTALSYADEAGGMLYLELSGAQLDRDPGMELAIVVSETFGSGRNGSPGNGTARYFIHDDLGNGLELLAQERVAAFVDGATRDGLLGTLAVGDFDGDNLDEIIVAAITEYFPVECQDILSLQIAIDDIDAGLAEFAAGLAEYDINNCESSGNNGWTAYLWADALDVDGDGYDEFHVNSLVFEDFVNAAPFTRIEGETRDDDNEALRIPKDYLFSGQGNNQRLRTTRENTVMTVADINGDGNDEILAYAPIFASLESGFRNGSFFRESGYAVTAWGIDPFTGIWDMLYYEELDGLYNDEDQFGPPLVVAANVDDDATVLRYTGKHEIVFTEPIVLAVLSAPPCWGDGVQVTSECRTSWGRGNIVGGSASLSHEVTASAHVSGDGSLNLPFIGEVGVSVKETVGARLAIEASVGYETRRTITYTTGAMEDTVIANVVPYDRYTYTIEADPVYPQAVGESLVISIPRTPRTIQIERQFFNSAVGAEGVRIGSEVLAHTIGDVSTYPTRSEMNSIIGFLGRRIGPVSVGASSGSTTVEISESIVAGLTTSVSTFYEKEIEVDAGPGMVGATVGAESSATIGVFVGAEVVYTGSVGDMPPETFTLDRGYSYGLFTYTVDHPSGQSFPVINYWVE